MVMEWNEVRNQELQFVPIQKRVLCHGRNSLCFPPNTHFANQQTSWLERRQDLRKEPSIDVIEEDDYGELLRLKVIVRRVASEEFQIKVTRNGGLAKSSKRDFRDVCHGYIPASFCQPKRMPSEPTRQIEGASTAGEGRLNVVAISADEEGVGFCQ
jgi:hypothetical protein